jgi:hypothetical protein
MFDHPAHLKVRPTGKPCMIRRVEIFPPWCIISFMMEGKSMPRKHFVLFALCVIMMPAAGCYDSSPKTPAGDGHERDPAADDWRADDWRTDDWAFDDWTWDDWTFDDWTWEDWYPDPIVDDPVVPDTDVPCPAVCQTPPESGEIGAACVSSATCDHAAECITESVESFNGEMYFDSYGGTCVLYGEGTLGCDPAMPATCPDGSGCIFMGSYMGMDYHGCWDSCEPADTSGNVYDYNCGCRVGYACSLTEGICLSGCSHDRECCERWWDLNGDYARQADEVVVREGCTNTCDNGGLFLGGHPALCMVSFGCINNGDPSARWGGPCEGDAWCPPDGTCWDEFNYRDETTGESLFPGGYCIKEACNFVGRGCSAFGGACANIGSIADPIFSCLGACHAGKELSDPSYECRTAPGEEQACLPVDPAIWLSPPPGGEDGYCWPGNFPGGGKAIGEPCGSDEECVSPYGLGMCLDINPPTMTPFCGAYCSEASAIATSLCGGNDGSGIATGACWLEICWEACGDAGGPLGSSGCSSPDNACYPTSMMGTFVKVGSGLSIPVGICVPRCLNDAWCEDMWGMPMACDTTSGVCG